VRSPAQPRMDQGRHQLWTVLVNAPPQKKISASPIAMAAEQVGRRVVFHHELVTFGLRQKGADAVVDVGARKSLLVLGQVSESLIQPALFLEYDRPDSVRRSGFSTENDGMHVFVGQDGPQMGTRLEVGAQVHHVATV